MSTRLPPDAGAGKSVSMQIMQGHSELDLKKCCSAWGSDNEDIVQENSDDPLKTNNPLGTIANCLRNILPLLIHEVSLETKKILIDLITGGYFLQFSDGAMKDSSLAPLPRSNIEIFAFDNVGVPVNEPNLSMMLFVKGKDCGRTTIMSFINPRFLAENALGFYDFDQFPYVMFGEGGPPYPMQYRYSRTTEGRVETVDKSIVDLINGELSSRYYQLMREENATFAKIDNLNEANFIERIPHGERAYFLNLISIRHKLKKRYTKLTSEPSSTTLWYHDSWDRLVSKELPAIEIPLRCQPLFIDSFQSAVFGNTGGNSSYFTGGMEKSIFNSLANCSKRFNIIAYPPMSKKGNDFFTQYDADGAFDGYLIANCPKSEWGRDGWLMGRTIGYTTRRAGKKFRSSFYYLSKIECDRKALTFDVCTYGGKGKIFKKTGMPNKFVPYETKAGRFESNACIPKSILKNDWTLILNYMGGYKPPKVDSVRESNDQPFIATSQTDTKWNSVF